jgi:2-polyprenyl-6-methoxyphenol hydroxylase-like FAD-dependent oxidoreductase
LTKLEIAIAGAGPGGLAAALAIHSLGHRAVIYDQFDTPKPLGSGLILQPTGLSVLDWLGLGDKIKSLGARIDRLFGVTAHNRRTVLDVRYDALGAERGLAVHRAALFNVLFDAVKDCDISIETGKPVSGADSGTLIFKDGSRTPRFDLIIDALGTRSTLRQLYLPVPNEKALAYGALWASLPWPENGFDPHALEQRYDKASVMLGVLPIGKVRPDAPQQAAFFWSIRHNDMPVWRSRGLEAWKQDVLRYWPETDGLLQHLQHADDLAYARYQHHTVSRPFADRLISIGDSFHSTSPQLGQGANMALLDVRALTKSLQTNDDVNDAARDYLQRRRNHVRLYQAMSWMFTPFYQSDSVLLPTIRDHVVPPLARIPIAQRFLARMVAGTLVRPIRGGGE